MGKKTLLAMALAAVAALGASSGAMAATPKPTDVTDFSAKITTAKLVIQDLVPDGLEVPGTDPALAGKTINVTGTIAKNGTVSVAPSGFDFPEVSLGDALPIPGVSADIVLGSQATGSLNTATGAFSLPLSLGVKLLAPDLGITCLINGLSFTFGTSNSTIGSTTLIGSAWSAGSFGLTGKSALPDVSKVPASDCPSYVAALAAGAGLTGKQVALKLSGTTTIGTSYKTPAVATISGSTALSAKSGKASIKVKCAGTSAKNRPCVGNVVVALPSKSVSLTVPYTAAAGKTVTVNLSLTSAQKTALGKNKKVSGTVDVTVDNGKGVAKKSGSLTVKS